MYETIKYKGDPALNARLLMLPATLQRIALREATRRAGKILQDAFKKLAPIQTGALQRSARVEIRDYKDGTIIIGIVGPPMDYVETIRSIRGNTKQVRPAKYLHLVESGTKQRQTNSGQNRGAMPARPFIHQARQEVASQVANIFQTELEKQLNEIGR
jgi:HK97 gp10 family phage protein